MTADIQTNINNLTSLWRLIGKGSGHSIVREYFECSYIPGGEWPNRIWLPENPSLTPVDQVKAYIQQLNIPITVSLFRSSADAPHAKRMSQAGFRLKSRQMGMNLTLPANVSPSLQITLKRVESTGDAHTWEALFYSGFNYRINADCLLKAKESASSFIVYYEGTAVGTVITYPSPDIILGIHSMSIIPAMRGKGLGGSIVSKIIEDAAKAGIETITLQASEMGHSLYKSLGFKDIFLMDNYILEK